MTTTASQEAPERFPIKLPAGFDPTRHLDGLKQQINKMYPNAAYAVHNIDTDSLTAMAIRERNVSEVHKDTKADAVVVNLVKGTKTADGPAIAAKYEAQHPGYVLTDFEPFLLKARLTRLTDSEKHARDALSIALMVKPWDVKIRNSRDGGFDVVLPKTYVPSKHDQKLDEVVTTAIGDEGWLIQTNSKTYRARILPGDPPTFEKVYHFDFSSLPNPKTMTLKEQFSIPIGMGLAPRGQENAPVFIDFSDSVGLLCVGLAGSGKATLTSECIPVPVQKRFPTGWATVGDLEVGDLVFARDGSATALIGFSDVEIADVYNVHLSDGQVVRVNGKHLWKASSTVSRSVHTPKMVTRRSAHRADYVARAEKLRELARQTTPGVSANLMDIAKIVGMNETQLYPFASEFAHLAVEVALVGTGHSVTRSTKVYPVDEVISWLADRVERQSMTDRRNREVMPLEQLVTTEEMLETLRYGQIERANWAIRLADPIEGEDIDLTVPGYTLGAWLGDGLSRSGAVVSMDDPIIEAIATDGYVLNHSSPTQSKASIYWFDDLFADLQSVLDRSTTLKSKGSLDKRIPARYLRASVETRLAVLQGLMDTDGTIGKQGSCELGLSKHDLALDALELIRSLGIKATITEKQPTYMHNGVKKTGSTHYRIKFTTTLPVFRLPRKSERLPTELRETQSLLYVTDITISEPEPMRCLKVAHHEHLYLTGGFVPTHNSVATQAIVFNALARGWQLALINTVDKATDFIWAKPFVKDHMWGCDSVAQSVTVAKLVVEHGEKMGALLSEHGVSKWQDLPDAVRTANPPLLLVADELAALLVAPKIPPGLPREVKALPEFVQMAQDLLEANLLMTTLSKIPAVYRAAGIRVEYLTQQPNERYGFSTSLKGNLPHRVMLGVNPSPAEKGHAFRTPEKVPDVPKNIATDGGLARGVGLAHLDGQDPTVIKGYFAPLDDYLAEAKRRKFPVTLNPEPTARMIEKMVPRIDDDGGFDDDEPRGGGRGGSGNDGGGGFGRGERQLEEWEIDPNTGKPLDGRQRANMAKAKLARDARETARDD